MKIPKKDIEKLCEWYDIFNGFEWPSDYPVKPPLDWNEIPHYDRDKTIRTKHEISRPIMQTIIYIVGEKEHLRYHHLHNLRMNDCQFEIWWLARNMNTFFRKLGFSNFYIDIYSLLKWRNYG